MGAALTRATVQDRHHVGRHGCHRRRRHNGGSRHRRSHRPRRDARLYTTDANHNPPASLRPEYYHGAPTTLRSGLTVTVVNL